MGRAELEGAQRVTESEFDSLATEFSELSKKHSHLLRILEEQSKQIHILAKERAERKAVQDIAPKEDLRASQESPIRLDSVLSEQVPEWDADVQAAREIPILEDLNSPPVPTHTYPPMTPQAQLEVQPPVLTQVHATQAPPVPIPILE